MNSPTLAPGLLDCLLAAGHTSVRILDGQVCGVKSFLFTSAIVVGIDECGYSRRYCYEHQADAQAALLAWNGLGHPGGPWIKCKGSGIDLLNPAFS